MSRVLARFTLVLIAAMVCALAVLISCSERSAPAARGAQAEAAEPPAPPSAVEEASRPVLQVERRADGTVEIEALDRWDAPYRQVFADEGYARAAVRTLDARLVPEDRVRLREALEVWPLEVIREGERFRVRARDRWGAEVDIVYGSAAYLREAAPVLARRLGDEDAARLRDAVAALAED